MNMHVILFTSAANSSGGSRQALYLAQGMAERGHNVRFFVPERSTLPDLAPGETFWRSLGKPGQWRGRIEAAMPAPGEALVVHAFHNAAVKRAAWWGLFWRKRAVVVAHRGVLFRPRNPLPYWSPGIDAFLVNSRACAQVLRGLGVREKRLEYVPNAVPDSRLAAPVPAAELRAGLGIGPDAPLFLCIGGNKPYKGVTELITAFARAFPRHQPALDLPQPLSQPLPHLVILGLSPDRWRDLPRELGLADRVHCLGRTEDVGSYLAAANAFVLPSLSESMPNTLLEAMRAGLPCIGSAVGAVPDMLEGCGIVTPPGDVPALAKALQRLLIEPDLAPRLAAATRREAQAFVPARRLDRLEDIYLSLLRRKGLGS